MTEVKFSRQELYDLIWSESILSLSKKYAISNVGLRKKCRTLDIPIPNAGYWAKVKYGKSVTVRKLPDTKIADKEVILKLREASDNNGTTENISPSDLQKQIEGDVRLNLTVPDKLTNPVEMIVSVKDNLTKQKVWNNNEGITRSSRGELDIRVNPNNIGRALRFMDTLIKACKTRGHEFIINNGMSFIRIQGEDIEFCCREKLTRVIIKDKWGEHTDNQANGLLSFRIKESYHTNEWTDGKKPLEEQLSRIIAFLEIKGKTLNEERLRREKRRQEREEKELIEKALQQRKEKELEDFKGLMLKAKRHDKAEMIRTYIDKLKESAIARDELTAELNERIAWTRQKADWYDPFIELDDELLRDVDRDELKFKKKNPWS